MKQRLRIQPRRRPHWLCVAYAFPPINRSGTHRTLGFVRHLDDLGWDASVLTVDPRDEPLDDTLLAYVPRSTAVFRTPWVDTISRVKSLLRMTTASGHEAAPTLNEGRGSVGTNSKNWAAQRRGVREFISRLLITPDSRVGWMPAAYRKGMEVIRDRRPDIIYSTSPYMSAHLIALTLKLRTGIPWVADFRDPWRDNPFRELGFSSLNRWDAWLEGRVLRHAMHIVCNTSTMAARLCERIPSVANKCSTIMNGIDYERLETITPTRQEPAGNFVLCHSGQFYGPRSPKIWLAALKGALATSPRKIVMTFVGPSTYDGIPLEELAAEAGVADHVRVIGPKSHSESLSYLAGSDALMLAGSGGGHGDLQVPNKLFEYMALRKPVIAAVPIGNPVVDILQKAGVPALICDPSDCSGLTDAIVRCARDPNLGLEGAWTGLNLFDRVHRAEQLADIFHRLCTSGRDNTARSTSKSAAVNAPWPTVGATP